MIRIKNLNKSFKNIKILKDVSFDIEDSEVVVLLGESGAGKTTLMRCINGLEEFDSGEIILNDKILKNHNDMEKIRGKIGMVFQNFNLFPHLTVLENIIEAPVNVFKKEKEKAINEAKEILKIVNMDEKLNFYPYQLSGGQKQRVAIARACALNPKIMCFDEPTSALDPESIKNVISIINNLKEKGMSILIVTHDIGFCYEIADKMIKIEDGIIKEIVKNEK
ncbi:amino acid ABC transporter ATP-binding protein [Peptacetobacter sp.]|uniref:amino acid ABC transporter ATP-binding protein n=1 Tax=Peptacetobacter sp. TaxID=2991975 RepID=UPI00260360EB|nr:amino acid ABC transporter ATP-binding protein [Peptacetobacter sp.]